MHDSTVILTALGIVATVCGGLIWALKYVLTEVNSTMKISARTNQQLATSIDKLNKSLVSNSEREEEFRREMLAEQAALKEHITFLANRNLKAINALHAGEPLVDDLFKAEATA